MQGNIQKETDTEKKFNYFSRPKVLTKYERPKMKRDAGQKCSHFLRVCISLGLYSVFAAAKLLNFS